MILTPRERAVCDLICEDHADKDIAAILRISRPAVSRRVETAKQKMGVKTRAGLALACCGIFHHRQFEKKC